jgi:aryl-alcohol dehydrogenase-like predicted oxidoreductase
MQVRKLGNSGFQVSAIGLGCMVMPGFYFPGGEADSIATLHRAAEIGVTHLDTSDFYGAGKNEELLCRAIAGRRDAYTIASKFGSIRTPEGKGMVDGRPDYVRRACDASLRRLGIDTIDLYYQHRHDPDVPIEDTVGAMSGLIEAGKVRYLGLSEAAPDIIRRAHATHPVTALQSEYSLWTREAEIELLALCRELGIGHVAYAPLGRGIFGGAISGTDSLAEDDRRRDHPRFDKDNLGANLKLVEPVKRLAEAKGVQPAQIALAWILAQGDDIVPIPGTRRIDHLETNAGAVDLELTADDLASLSAAVPLGAAAGERYPAGAMARVYQQKAAD